MLHIIHSVVPPNADDTAATNNVFTAHPSFHESAAARGFSSKRPRRTDEAEEPGDSVTRLLGAHLPAGEVVRLPRFTYKARQAERYRYGRILPVGEAAHLFRIMSGSVDDLEAAAPVQTWSYI
ncbi:MULTISPECIES: hypothetical protein [unclassified Streptomyces]|uniref:hypothetical protein n=1 Tax=unclassified Streptomyces TaxID=2593676 RepID=UPI002E11400F|nr:hypothetical protein OG348_39730 [Streptomyces sp. NBC_01243]